MYSPHQCCLEGGLGPPENVESLTPRKTEKTGTPPRNDTIIYEEDNNDSDKENGGLTEVMAFGSNLDKFSEILVALNIDSDDDFDGF
jgi:hypothetical protein